MVAMYAIRFMNRKFRVLSTERIYMFRKIAIWENKSGIGSLYLLFPNSPRNLCPHNSA
jgi:hypothetical protein